MHLLLQWRTVYDEYNDEEVTLTREEMQMIQRIRAGQFPHVEVRSAAPLVSRLTCSSTAVSHVDQVQHSSAVCRDSAVLHVLSQQTMSSV